MGLLITRPCESCGHRHARFTGDCLRPGCDCPHERDGNGVCFRCSKCTDPSCCYDPRRCEPRPTTDHPSDF